MKVINLRDIYPHYTQDCFVEVTDEVADLFSEFDHKEAAYRLRTYRHKAYFSLDYDVNVERDALVVVLTPADILEQKNVDVRVQTAIEMRAIAEPYIRSRAIRHLEKGRVVIFGCGTGNPYFSTDTAAVLRAAEIDADVILLAKNIDGVYSADPRKDPNAIKYDSISYDDVLAQHLEVMDSTATSLSMDNRIPVILFALKDPENIYRVVMGEKIGTIVKEEK